jgi:4a-hydroxytetrahydrobiopterin dehydratase
MELTKKRCLPCEGGVLPLDDKKVEEFLNQISEWSLKNGHLYKEFRFKSFKETMAFLNKVANISENEGHHPDFCVHFRLVEMEIWTHAIDGLSENDFILAAKIDKLLK